MSQGRLRELWAPEIRVLTIGLILTITVVASESIGRCLPPPLRARMIAVISTAWVAPGLAGPALSAEVAHALGWRWVFIGLLPVVGIAGSIAVPALARLGRPQAAQAVEHMVTDAILASAGTAMILAPSRSRSVPARRNSAGSSSPQGLSPAV